MMHKLEDPKKELKPVFDPIITSMDFLKNPVFIPSFDVPDGYNGEFLVNGKVQVSLKGPALKANEADVFHALTHTAKSQEFKQHEVYFVMNDLLKLMRWERDGKNYARLKKSIDTLLEAGIEIEGVLEKMGKRSRRWQILTGRELSSGTNKSQDTQFKSWVRFSEEMLQLFKSGALKAIHPVYFELKSPLEKRLFSLLSVRASDLECWSVSLVALRELLPLTGKTYQYQSKIWDTLKGSLQRLKERGVLHEFELKKDKNSKQSSLCIWPNHDFFVSAKKRFSQKVTMKEEPIVIELVKRGISEKVAKNLIIETKDIQNIDKQLEHFDRKLTSASTTSRPGPGWLVEAIRNDYTPSSHVTSDDEEKKSKLRAELIKTAQNFFRQGQYEPAIQQAHEALKLGISREADDVIKEAHQEINRKNQIQKLKARLSAEELNLLKQEAWQLVTILSKKPLQEIQASPMYQAFCEDKVNELVIGRHTSFEL